MSMSQNASWMMRYLCRCEGHPVIWSVMLIPMEVSDAIAEHDVLAVYFASVGSRVSLCP